MINFNLRIVLLILGALFVLAILLDGLRRKYRRNQRLNLMDEQSAKYAEPRTEQLDIQHRSSKSGQPSVGHVDWVEHDSARQRPTLVTEQVQAQQPISNQPQDAMPARILTVYVQARVDKPYKGYELLQAILTAGLRFGQMNIFHRYQGLNGQGPILFSLASANEPGTFDIRNMGKFVCTGLSLFFRLSTDKAINIQYFDRMLETANQFAETLGGQLLDDNGQTFSIATYKHYRQMIDQANQAVEHA